MKPREIAAASVAQVLIKRRCAMGATLLHAEPAEGGDAIVHLAVRVPAARIDEILADCQAVPSVAAPDEEIRALRAATAAAGGNAELVEVCDIALGDKPAPFGPGLETRELCRAECERTIARPDDGRRVPAGLRTQAEVEAFDEAMIDGQMYGGES